MADDLDLLERDLGDQLRRTLHAVADTPPSIDRSRSARRRRVFGGAALAAVVAIGGVAAWQSHDDGEIVRIPVEQALITGEGSSGDWWLLPSQHTDVCGNPMPGVELVSGQINKPGYEWNTGGVAYGEHGEDPCVFDGWERLGDPALSNIGYSRIGYERDSTPWGGFGAVHSSVTAVRVSADDSAPFVTESVPRADDPDGPRYVAFSMPSDTVSVTIETIDADGDVIPGSAKTTHLQ
ncbi:MAG: hypothetical protein OSA99_21465 [Acidimicrobiales bacterium]|nr:hypothetical protein [Acidimicrobiales bacterium]